MCVRLPKIWHRGRSKTKIAYYEFRIFRNNDSGRVMSFYITCRLSFFFQFLPDLLLTCHIIDQISCSVFFFWACSNLQIHHTYVRESYNPSNNRIRLFFSLAIIYNLRESFVYSYCVLHALLWFCNTQTSAVMGYMANLTICPIQLELFLYNRAYREALKFYIVASIAISDSMNG